MKKTVKELALGVIAKMALEEAKKGANSACLGIAYQPNVPDSIKKLRKF